MARVSSCSVAMSANLRISSAVHWSVSTLYFKKSRTSSSSALIGLFENSVILSCVWFDEYEVGVDER